MHDVFEVTFFIKTLQERATMPPQMVGPFVAKARGFINDLENLPMQDPDHVTCTLDHVEELV